MSEPILQIYFTVYGEVVGKNKRHVPIITQGRPRIILSEEARNFMRRVMMAGAKAREQSSWPRNMLVPRHVRLNVEVYNTKHDAAASSPLIADALQGIFYPNDNILCYGPQDLPYNDGGEARVVVGLELLKVYSLAEVRMRRIKEQELLKKRIQRGNRRLSR